MIFRDIADRLTGRVPRGAKRSKDWPKVRDAFLKLNPRCAACGSRKNLVVHHRIPFHVEQSRELDVTNLITLCESKTGGANCHLFFGHLGRWTSYNHEVGVDAMYWYCKVRHRP